MVETLASQGVGRLLVKVCELKHRRMHELLDKLGLYKGQPGMLRALWERDGLTQSALVERLGRCPATITKMVQRMEKAGFVERRPDPNDERLSHVYLTDAGRDIQAAVQDVWRTFEEQAFATFSEEEVLMFRGLLIRICQNIEETIDCR